MDTEKKYENRNSYFLYEKGNLGIESLDNGEFLLTFWYRITNLDTGEQIELDIRNLKALSKFVEDPKKMMFVPSHLEDPKKGFYNRKKVVPKIIREAIRTGEIKWSSETEKESRRLEELISCMKILESCDDPEVLAEIRFSLKIMIERKRGINLNESASQDNPLIKTAEVIKELNENLAPTKKLVMVDELYLMFQTKGD